MTYPRTTPNILPGYVPHPSPTAFSSSLRLSGLAGNLRTAQWCRVFGRTTPTHTPQSLKGDNFLSLAKRFATAVSKGSKCRLDLAQPQTTGGGDKYKSLPLIRASSLETFRAAKFKISFLLLHEALIEGLISRMVSLQSKIILAQCWTVLVGSCHQPCLEFGQQAMAQSSANLEPHPSASMLPTSSWTVLRNHALGLVRNLGNKRWHNLQHIRSLILQMRCCPQGV